MSPAKRVSVPLEPADLHALERLSDPGTAPGRRLLRALGGTSPSSEGGLVAALMRLGIDRLHDEAATDGYRWLAMTYESDEERRLGASNRARTRRHHRDTEEPS